MVDTLITQGVTFLITFLSKEEHMLFIGGLVIGLVIGGLFGRFVLPLIWKPKV